MTDPVVTRGVVTPLWPQRSSLAVEDKSDPAETTSFTIDQVQTLGYALAGLRADVRTAFEETLAVELAVVRSELWTEFEKRLATAVDTAKADIRDDLRADLTARLDASRSATDELRSEFRTWLDRAINATVQESELGLAAVRSEILARLDKATFGTMLVDVDPRDLEKAIGVLKIELADRFKTAGERMDALAQRFDTKAGRELNELREQVATLQSRINLAERLAAKRAEGMAVKDAKVDVDNYRMTLVRADGSTGPTLDLGPLFQQFFDQNLGDR